MYVQTNYIHTLLSLFHQTYIRFLLTSSQRVEQLEQLLINNK